MKNLLLLLLLALPLNGQTIGNYTANKLVGGTKPTTCNAGPPADIWIDTATPSAPVFNICGTTGYVAIATLSGGAVPVAQGGTGTTTAFTLGSIVFAGAAGVYSQDNARFFWDDTANIFKTAGSNPGALEQHDLENLDTSGNAGKGVEIDIYLHDTVNSRKNAGRLSWSAADANIVNSNPLIWARWGDGMVLAFYESGFNTVTNNSPTTLVTLATASNSSGGGSISFSCAALTATPHNQATSGLITYAIQNTGGTPTCQSVVVGTNSTIADSGTLAGTTACTVASANVSINLTCNSSLTTPTVSARYTLTNMSNYSVTLAW